MYSVVGFLEWFLDYRSLYQTAKTIFPFSPRSGGCIDYKYIDIGGYRYVYYRYSSYVMDRNKLLMIKKINNIVGCYR